MTAPPFHPANAFIDKPDAPATLKQTAATATRSPLMGRVNLAGWADKPIPEIAWIVPGWIPSRAVTLLYGAGGVGKSYLALQAAVAAHAGGTWLGLPVERCRSLYLSCEDDEAIIVRRLRHIAEHHGVGLSDLDADLQVFDRVGLDNALFDFEDWRSGTGEPSALLAQVMNAALNAEARLVIIDSLHNTFSGNENVRVQVEAYMRTLRSLATEIDGAVIVLAHPSRAGQNSGDLDGGSTSWHALARGRLTLEKSRDVPGIRTLKNAKQNHAAEGEPIDLRWSDPGMFVRAEAVQDSGGMVGSIVRRNVEKVFLDLLAKAEAAGRPVSESNRAGNYAPKLFSLSPHRAGYGKRDFEKAMESLFAAGRITTASYGRTSDQRRKIVAVELPGSDHE